MVTLMQVFHPATVEIIGNRSTHPRHGATSDLRLRVDGVEDGFTFARYADAYRAALELTTAEHIKRNGKIARRA